MIQLTVIAEPTVGLLYPNIEILSKIFTESFIRTMRMEPAHGVNETSVVSVSEGIALASLKRLNMDDKVEACAALSDSQTLVLSLKLKSAYSHGLTATVQ